MRYKIAIVEDSPEFSELVKKYFDKFSQEEQVDFDLDFFSDGDEIIYEYEPKYQVFFLDIMMKRVNGMEAAKIIRQYDQDVIIIFITNMSNYAIEGYSVNALGYLLKPLSYFAFKQELIKCIDKINSKTYTHILIPQENGIVKLGVSDILYIESFKHMLTVVTKEKVYEYRGTLKELEATLKDKNFYRSNNCYLVNLKWVSGVSGDFCVIEDHSLKISRPRKKGFMEALTNYIGDAS